jgi:small-conductance mechanosensitive channel
VLREVADANPLCLMHPGPMIIFDGYGDSALQFSFRVWATRENWLELKNTIHEEVKNRFDEEGIEIPFPHRTLYAGLRTGPFPVRVVTGDDVAAEDGSTVQGDDVATRDGSTVQDGDESIDGEAR